MRPRWARGGSSPAWNRLVSSATLASPKSSMRVASFQSSRSISVVGLLGTLRRMSCMSRIGMPDSFAASPNSPYPVTTIGMIEMITGNVPPSSRSAWSRRCSGVAVSGTRSFTASSSPIRRV